MKIPDISPSFADLLEEIGASRFVEIAGKAGLTDEKGRYLHWDQLRHKQPPAGLTLKEWWLGIHMARRSASQKLAFSDKQKRAFFYTEPPELKALMRFVDVNAAGLLGSSEHGLSLEDGGRYLRRSLAEEPFASSFIEGAVTTRDIAKQMIFENRPAYTADERMVLNNYHAMEFVKANCREELTQSLVLELHRIMTDGTLDNPDGVGRLRRSDEDIKVVHEINGEIVHIPPAAEELPDRLLVLCQFANKDNNDLSYCHPLIRAMTLHFMLSYDHPFIDGNGRTARALFYWSLLRDGYWLMEYTSISGVMAEAPASYYKAFLFTETDEGDLTYFFLHQARVTRAALEKMQVYADEKRHEFNEFQKIVAAETTKYPLNDRQVSLLQEFGAGREREMRIDVYQKRYRISYLTARSDLEALTDRGLVKKKKVGRSSVYLPFKKLP